MREIYNNYLHYSEIFATFAVVLSVNQFNYSQFYHFSL